MKIRTTPFFRFVAIGLICLSCKGEWSQKEKDKIVKNCLEETIKMGFSNPKEHCDCFLTSILIKYPNPNQFENLEMGEYGQLMMECQGKVNPTRIIWPERTQKAFVDSCSKMAFQMNKNRPKEYCRCVLENLMEKYPTNDDLGTINAKVMAEIGVNCEASVGK